MAEEHVAAARRQRSSWLTCGWAVLFNVCCSMSAATPVQASLEHRGVAPVRLCGHKSRICIENINWNLALNKFVVCRPYTGHIVQAI